MITGADQATETVQILEIVRLANNSDMTYVPGPEPMQLLRFGLPPDAFDLQVDTGLQPAEVFQVDRGFAVSASVPPGEHEVLYSYSIPYTGGTLSFDKNFGYGAGQIRIVAPQAAMNFEVEPLGSPELLDIGGLPYHVLERSDVPRGTMTTFTFTGLPESTFGERVGRNLDNIRWELAAPVTLGVVLFGVVGFAVFWKTRFRDDGDEGEEPPLDERELVLNMITDLDEERKEGGMDEEDYRRRRSLLTTRLKEIRRPVGADE